LIKCLLNRAWQICSDLKLFHLEVLKVKIILRKNDYPNKVIDREIERFFNDKFKDKFKAPKKLETFLVLKIRPQKTRILILFINLHVTIVIRNILGKQRETLV
jgi:hypothetical protein